MRKLYLLTSIALVALAVPRFAGAQGFIPAGAPPAVYADNYGRWAIAGQAANSYVFTPGSVCQITQLNFQNQPTFYAFSDTLALAPVLVADVNSANSELVTPGSFLTPTQTTCGANLSPSHSHTTFTLQSGTGGLQEAINAVGGYNAPTPVEIILSPEWYKLVSYISNQNSTLASTTPASIIAAATGSVNAILVDITTAPPTQYVWTGSGGYVSGTQYYALGAKPTVAAGTGAGTSPTISASGTSTNGTVTLTTGSAVPAAADPIFTLTWPSPGTAGSKTSGFQYAPTCTFVSTGVSPGTTTNTSVKGPPAVATLTSPATGLTSSTAGYSWTYSCH
jgi:hypothetical protein